MLKTRIHSARVENALRPHANMFACCSPGSFDRFLCILNSAIAMGTGLAADFSAVTGTQLYNAIVDFTRVTLPPDDRTAEGYTVDFKEVWGKKALRVVAAFANTFGGIVIVGVSEEKGKAKDIVGELSKSELKTRFAGAIAANIAPTPSYDIAECEIPLATDRRLCAIRVRPADTTKGESPVYVRNEDQALNGA